MMIMNILLFTAGSATTTAGMALLRKVRGIANKATLVLACGGGLFAVWCAATGVIEMLAA